MVVKVGVGVGVMGKVRWLGQLMAFRQFWLPVRSELRWNLPDAVTLALSALWHLATADDARANLELGAQSKNAARMALFPSQSRCRIRGSWHVTGCVGLISIHLRYQIAVCCV